LFENLIDNNTALKKHWDGVGKVSAFNELKLRHSTNCYKNMTQLEFDSLIKFSNMQKLLLGKIPPQEFLDELYVFLKNKNSYR